MLRSHCPSEAFTTGFIWIVINPLLDPKSLGGIKSTDWKVKFLHVSVATFFYTIFKRNKRFFIVYHNTRKKIFSKIHILYIGTSHILVLVCDSLLLQALLVPWFSFNLPRRCIIAQPLWSHIVLLNVHCGARFYGKAVNSTLLRRNLELP